MDSIPDKSGSNGSFLTECVTDTMTAPEAAESTRACWNEAEDSLAPVLGREGLVVVFRHSEDVALRHLDLVAPPSARKSIDAFCDWVRSLSTAQAVTACKFFLVSVESYLVSLLGHRILRRLLRRAQEQSPTQPSH